MATFSHIYLYLKGWLVCVFFETAHRQFLSPKSFAVPGFFYPLSSVCLHYSVLNDYLFCGDSSTLLIQ